MICRNRRVGVALALASLVVLAGCASAPESNGSSAQSEGESAAQSEAPRRDDGGAVGSPAGGNGSGPSIASPVRVPLPTNVISGMVFSDAVEALIPRIVEACGGTRCVNVAKKVNDDPDDDLDEQCDKVDNAEGVEPAEDGSGAGSVTVPRNGTIYLLVNVSCDDLPETPTPTPEETETTSAPEEESAPADGDDQDSS